MTTPAPPLAGDYGTVADGLPGLIREVFRNAFDVSVSTPNIHREGDNAYLGRSASAELVEGRAYLRIECNADIGIRITLQTDTLLIDGEAEAVETWVIVGDDLPRHPRLEGLDKPAATARVRQILEGPVTSVLRGYWTKYAPDVEAFARLAEDAEAYGDLFGERVRFEHTPGAVSKTGWCFTQNHTWLGDDPPEDGQECWLLRQHPPTITLVRLDSEPRWSQTRAHAFRVHVILDKPQVTGNLEILRPESGGKGEPHQLGTLIPRNSATDHLAAMMIIVLGRWAKSEMKINTVTDIVRTLCGEPVNAAFQEHFPAEQIVKTVTDTVKAAAEASLVKAAGQITQGLAGAAKEAQDALKALAKDARNVKPLASTDDLF